jgi:hypothetical protein
MQRKATKLNLKIIIIKGCTKIVLSNIIKKNVINLFKTKIKIKCY